MPASNKKSDKHRRRCTAGLRVAYRFEHDSAVVSAVCRSIHSVARNTAAHSVSSSLSALSSLFNVCDAHGDKTVRYVGVALSDAVGTKLSALVFTGHCFAKCFRSFSTSCRVSYCFYALWTNNSC